MIQISTDLSDFFIHRIWDEVDAWALLYVNIYHHAVLKTYSTERFGYITLIQGPLTSPLETFEPGANALGYHDLRAEDKTSYKQRATKKREDIANRRIAPARQECA